MNKFIPLEFKNQRIMTTKVLADSFGTNDKIIQQNYKRNEERFIERKHYYRLIGQELKDFKADLQLEGNLKFTSELILWTDKGAARHAKILDTDEAWDVYEKLEENYFNPNKSVQVLDTSELSPELQMFKQIFDTVAKQQLENKEIKKELKETKEEIQGIRDAVTLEPNQWRKDTATLINKISNRLGGFQHIELIRKEAYKLLNSSYGVDINRRLLNKKKNMALEGCSKSKINKINYLDVIADDKKLINGYINIIGRLSVKYGIKE
ncbi:ORF6N domain-containing protein [Clostridium botulinum]|uniref:ORF6N domain-containing protein n=1 Tax=Clostridium TaxID=1485 RepID=UPI0005411151|nr:MULTISPECIES: ORF6N domain-containing protein [Clostridium]AIY81959.1 hypothetical protein U728_1715 [Clostridium botulinum 202F]KAI3347939.1 ORF6N domain-containing protein [Clostridium botulinum]KON14688.1 hypothetical protein ACP50_03975 [Clostridium botulinum]MBN1059382.1 ORF6N domain-containing protein [Clostridium botulinum]MBY6986463.1 ORF6N domain-containing protein [Clostridium botulinum]